MIVYVLGAAMVAFVLWRGWGKPVIRLGQWRAGAGLLSLGAFVAAAFVALRGQWEIGVALVAVGASLMFAARSPRGPPPDAATGGSGMLSEQEARSLLGVAETASAADIRAAYARLMRRAHPDHGGTSGLAAQLNMARDRLLKR